jgi:hypothetical protein
MPMLGSQITAAMMGAGGTPNTTVVPAGSVCVAVSFTAGLNSLNGIFPNVPQYLNGVLITMYLNTTTQGCSSHLQQFVNAGAAVVACNTPNCNTAPALTSHSAAAINKFSAAVLLLLAMAVAAVL